MSARSLAGALARNGSSVAPQATNWAWRWALATFVAVIVGVVSVLLWWTDYNSQRSVAIRWSEREIARGRACLLSTEWAHVDPDSGLAVVKLVRGGPLYCGDASSIWDSIWESPGRSPRPDEFVDGWNVAVRRHLAAGDASGPRFRDRVTTLDAVRERFRRDAAAAIPLPTSGTATVRNLEARWWGTTVNLREPGATKWIRPVGDRPVEPNLDEDIEVIDVTMLTADSGRSLWVRVASKTGQDLWFFVIDLATGTHLYTFDAASR